MRRKKPAVPVDDVKRKLVDEALKSSEGRKRLAEMMAAPIRQRMNYSDLSKAFTTQEIFHCKKCGFTHDDKDHVHSDEECMLNHVHGS